MTNFSITIQFQLQQNLQIIEGMQPNYLGWLSSSPSTRSLLSLTSGARKNKITELNDRRLTLWHEKAEGQKHLCFPGVNVGGTCSSLYGFAFTDFRWLKNKRTKLDDRRLSLYHEKVGGQKDYCPPPTSGVNVGGVLSLTLGGRKIK